MRRRPGQRDTARQVLNRAASSIAGIVSEELNVLGLMPHPENQPSRSVGRPHGRPLFESIAARAGARVTCYGNDVGHMIPNEPKITPSSSPSIA